MYYQKQHTHTQHTLHAPSISGLAVNAF